RKNGTPFDSEITIYPVTDETGWYTYWCSLQRDVTEERERTAQLRNARDQALAASRAKSEFLANMSHEIRTPMNAVIGMSELLLLNDLSPDQSQRVSTLRQAADGLLTILNDTLDFSKIEAGQFHLSSEEFDLRRLVEDATQILSIKAQQKHIELLCDVSHELPEFVDGDSSRLRQIIVNLVGNAIKFTGEGEVVVSVRPVEEDEDSLLLEFSVKDTGIGIPKDRLQTIFDPFVQADGSITRRYGGTGLGLAICSRIVVLLGGTIWVESEEGEGSEFKFTARVKRAQHQQDAEQTISGLTAPILVVDDNETNLRIVRDMLTSFGIPCETVSDAKQALERLSAKSDGYSMM
ncbi:MAG: ATP-binding protein, partial [Myxococcota bacterium]